MQDRLLLSAVCACHHQKQKLQRRIHIQGVEKVRVIGIELLFHTEQLLEKGKMGEKRVGGRSRAGAFVKLA